jgi:transketolase C-terminal domain/subunit
MGLEDIAFFRSVLDCVVLYPCDAMSTERLVEAAAAHRGMVYLRTTRAKPRCCTTRTERFPIGGCKVLRQGPADRATIVAAGITVHEALAAAEILHEQGTSVRVIDLYSVAPVDADTLRRAARETGLLITVEDHGPNGGIGEAVAGAVAGTACPVHKLAVRRVPRSGTPEELLAFEGIDRHAVVKALHTCCHRGDSGRAAESSRISFSTCRTGRDRPGKAAEGPVSGDPRLPRPLPFSEDQRLSADEGDVFRRSGNSPLGPLHRPGGYRSL